MRLLIEAFERKDFSAMDRDLITNVADAAAVLAGKKRVSIDGFGLVHLVNPDKNPTTGLYAFLKGLAMSAIAPNKRLYCAWMS